MKKSSKKPGGAKKNGMKRKQSRRRENSTKLLVLALAVRMRKKGTKHPKPTRPPATPIARIKGHAYPGGGHQLEIYCEVLGDMVDQAVDDMEEAIKQDDDAALQTAIEGFKAATDKGHRDGCYFSYV